MSLCVCVIKNRNHRYVRVCRAYRNSKGKPASEVVENHGRLDACLIKDPLYVEKLKERVAEQNRLEKEAETKLLEDAIATRMQKLVDAHQVSGKDALNDTSSALALNIGAAIVKQVWELLSMPACFQYLQSKTKIEYRYDHMAFMLSALRILSPSSKRATFEKRNNFIVDFSEFDNLKTVYNVLDQLALDKKSIIRYLNRQIGKLTQRKLTAAFYDVTTYDFESQEQSNLKDFGLSKAHKVNEVQVVLGLVMDDNGIPVDYELFPGNTSEFGTMIPIIKRVKETYGIDKLVVVADRGLNSSENLVALQNLGCDFVIAQKIKNCDAKVQQQIFNNENWEKVLADKETGEITCKYKKLAVSKDLKETKISEKTGKKYNTSKIIGTLETNWVVTYSPKRARKDNADTDRLVEKALKAINNKQSLTGSRGYKALLEIPKADGEIKLNQKKIDDRRKWAGYYAVCTNLPAEDHQSVMAIYRQLWQIEDCFRTSKSMLETRPCFVWTDEHIKGHFISCYLALVLERVMKYLVKKALPEMTAERMLAALREASVVPITNAGETAVSYIKVNVNDDFDAISKALDLMPLRRVESRNGLQKALKMRNARTR